MNEDEVGKACGSLGRGDEFVKQFSRNILREEIAWKV
jgi:hypothetical protein